MNALRPHPHRGDIIAAAAVPLALAGLLIELRMRQWSLGPRFAAIALIGGLILTMGWLTPLEGPSPRAYHSVLLISGLLLLIVALPLLAELLGARRPPGAGALAWTFATAAAVAAAAARRANSGACTLIAALAGGIALEAFVSWAFAPHGLGSFRAILLVLSLGYAAGCVRLRDRHRRHAVQLANAGGVVTLLLALSFLLVRLLAAVEAGLSDGSPAEIHSSAAFGWKLYVVAVGCGLIAYAGVDSESGPAYVGVLVLGAFALLAGLPVATRGSLVGWPLFLLAIGAAGLAVGLRPRRPLPPEPPAAGTAAAAGKPSPEPTPLHHRADREQP